MPDEVEALYIDKDQADCLLITLSDALETLPNDITELSDKGNREALYETWDGTPEEINKGLEELIALKKAQLMTIPSILEEIRGIYPLLQERSDPKNKIIKPSWSKKE